MTLAKQEVFRYKARDGAEIEGLLMLPPEYGVDFAMEGFEDPAGTEFNDIADAIEYLVSEKGADRERVGLGLLTR